MKRSLERTLTTHTGSLPRPVPLLEMLLALDHGTRPDEAVFAEAVATAVSDVVARQTQIGVDVVNDGEMSKVSYATYVTERLTGFGGSGTGVAIADGDEFPEWAQAAGLAREQVREIVGTPACIGAVSYVGQASLESDIANLKAAAVAAQPQELFMSAASPGVISLFLENQHYASHEEYLVALGEAMKQEYDAIYEAGITLQIDCPDLAMGRHLQFPGASLSDWRRTIVTHVEVLNEATRDIPPESMRMHICWGNYEGPHHLDVPLGDVVDIVLGARPAGIAFEAANPRHEHEWKVFEDVGLPEGKLLIPGVIDSTTNYIEHPEVVADRILNLARVVGRENVVAGVDCGFATAASVREIDAKIVFAKLRSLVEGADLASGELWAGRPAHTKVTLRG
jgi:5-methyltetrahydropteroyltriglutamate--homocysteine methyltransferase